MNYYQDNFRKRYEMMVCYCWLIAVCVMIAWGITLFKLCVWLLSRL